MYTAYAPYTPVHIASALPAPFFLLPAVGCAFCAVWLAELDGPAELVTLTLALALEPGAPDAPGIWFAAAEGSMVGGSPASVFARCSWNSSCAVSASGVVVTICTNGAVLSSP